eukprot:30374-Eustigmatos_ZCMA.PRE.1
MWLSRRGIATWGRHTRALNGAGALCAAAAKSPLRPPCRRRRCAAVCLRHEVGGGLMLIEQ